MWRNMAASILLLVVVFGYFDLGIERLPVLEPDLHALLTTDFDHIRLSAWYNVEFHVYA